MQHGAVINPYKMFNGVYVPHWLAMQPGISWSVKGVYARLGFEAHKDTGILTDPGQAVIAEAIGISERTVRTALADLVRLGLVQRESRGKMLTNRYFFLYHRWMDVELEVTGKNCRSPKVTGKICQPLENSAANRKNLPTTSQKSAQNDPPSKYKYKRARKGARGDEPARPLRRAKAGDELNDACGFAEALSRNNSGFAREVADEMAKRKK